MRELLRYDIHGTGRPIGKTAALYTAFGVIALLAVTARLLLYGDPRLAIATTDTQSYIDSSRAPLLSADSLSGRRLFTTNLVYKFVSRGRNCSQIIVSMPAIGKEGHREIQPCFEVVAVLQSLLSVAAWLWLAFVVFRRLTQPLAKLVGAALILLFGFTPQLAEWDSILGSESLTVSLFTISLGCLIELASSWTSESRRSAVYAKFLSICWLLFFALWLFVRDANLFAIPVTLMLLVPLAYSGSFSNKRPIPVLAILLISLFVLGLQTSRQSPRWQPSLRHSLESFIFPYPARMQFLSERFSMPDPRSAGYPSWFDSRAPTAFSAFLVLHPGFIIRTVIDNWIVFTHSYEQPYFQLESAKASSGLLQLGEVLHPASGVFYLLDTIALLTACAAMRAGAGRDTLKWAWVMTWLYLVGATTLLLSYFGDTDGVMRHIFPSLELFRLLMWLSLLILTDGYLDSADRNASRPTPVAPGSKASGAAADGAGI